MKPLLFGIAALLTMAYAQAPKWAATGTAIIVFTLAYVAAWVVRELREGRDA